MCAAPPPPAMPQASGGGMLSGIGGMVAQGESSNLLKLSDFISNRIYFQ